MNIQKATPNDIDAMVHIDSTSGYHSKPSKVAIKRLLKQFFKSVHPRAFILKNSSTPVGYVAFRKIKGIIEIDYFGITKNHQRKGLSKILLNKVFLYAKRNTIGSIRLSVRSTNTVAINLYKQFRFDIVKSQKNKLFMLRRL